MKIFYPRLEKTSFWTWWICTITVMPFLMSVSPFLSTETYNWLLLVYLLSGIVSVFLITYLAYLLTKRIQQSGRKGSLVAIGCVMAMSLIVNFLVPALFVGGKVKAESLIFILLPATLVPLISGVVIALVRFISVFVYDYYRTSLLRVKYEEAYYFFIPFVLMIISLILLPIGIPYAVIACITYAILSWRKVPVKVIELLPWEEEPARI